MNPTLGLILTILGAALTLLTVYGALKLDRKLFLSGICYFSFIPIIGEGVAYNTDKAAIHVIIIGVFLVQFVLALPNKIVYGPDNTAAVQIATKVSVAILIINVVGVIFLFCLTSAVPAQFGYYHAVIALSVLYLILKRVTSKGAAWLK